MKSTETYKIFESYLKSDLKANQYKKAKSSMLGYIKKIQEHYVNFWVQCSRDGFDKYAGSKFIVQFSISNNAEIGYRGLSGGRIAKYLTPEELEKVRLIQNSVIRRLTKPPRNYFPDSMPKDTVELFLKKFEQMNDPLTNNSDIWFRYNTDADVDEWSKYLKPIIIRTLTILEANPFG